MCLYRAESAQLSEGHIGINRAAATLAAVQLACSNGALKSWLLGGQSSRGTKYTLPRSSSMSLCPTSCLARRLLSCRTAPRCCLAAGCGTGLAPPFCFAPCCFRRCCCCSCRSCCCRQGSSRKWWAQSPSLSHRIVCRNQSRPCNKQQYATCSIECLQVGSRPLSTSRVAPAVIQQPRSTTQHHCSAATKSSLAEATKGFHGQPTWMPPPPSAASWISGGPGGLAARRCSLCRCAAAGAALLPGCCSGPASSCSSDAIPRALYSSSTALSLGSGAANPGRTAGKTALNNLLAQRTSDPPQPNARFSHCMAVPC